MTEVTRVPSRGADLTGDGFTELANARRLVSKHGEELRYCTSWDCWLVWSGTHWAVDHAGVAELRMKSVVDDLWDEVKDCSRQGKECRDLMKHAAASASSRGIRNALSLAQGEPGVPIDHDSLDRNPWLLNVPNGTLELRTGELRLHDPRDLITKLCPVAFVPNATCPVWDRFLATILMGNAELISFLQRAIGYSLTGDVGEQVLFMLHGQGANGKSTFLNALLDLLGSDYAMQAADGLLMTRHHEPHPTAMADLYGKRLVSSIEIEKNRRLAESTVKQLTGGDRIRARRMREDFWQFSPTHKLWLALNHKPIIQGTDHGIWRRLRLVPFEVTIAASAQDHSLSTKLADEREGILAWAVRGCLDWQQHGLGEPDQVTCATEQYREEMDTIGSFIKECCIEGDSQKAKASDVYEAYTRWCDKTGEQPITQRSFGSSMTERGFERVKNSGIWYRGVSLWDTTSGTNGRNGTIYPLISHSRARQI